MFLNKRKEPDLDPNHSLSSHLAEDYWRCMLDLAPIIVAVGVHCTQKFFWLIYGMEVTSTDIVFVYVWPGRFIYLEHSTGNVTSIQTPASLPVNR